MDWAFIFIIAAVGVSWITKIILDYLQYAPDLEARIEREIATRTSKEQRLAEVDGIIEVMTAQIRDATVDLTRSEAELRELQRILDSHKMALIPSGEFRMGSEDGHPHERPLHPVHLDAYVIDRYEVTNREYKRYLDVTGSPQPEYWLGGAYPLGKADHPVAMVSWDDANAFARWAGKRLPTEAEWEKAARGTDGRSYPWGNEFEQHRVNCGKEVRDTTPVGSYAEGVSPYGLHDMAGNVAEWVADWYDERYYEQSPPRNPKGPLLGIYRVIRGGVFNDFPSGVRCTARFPAFHAVRLMNVGFRCVKDAPQVQT